MGKAHDAYVAVSTNGVEAVVSIKELKETSFNRPVNVIAQGLVNYAAKVSDAMAANTADIDDVAMWVLDLQGIKAQIDKLSADTQALITRLS